MVWPPHRVRRLNLNGFLTRVSCLWIPRPYQCCRIWVSFRRRRSYIPASFQIRSPLEVSQLRLLRILFGLVPYPYLFHPIFMEGYHLFMVNDILWVCGTQSRMILCFLFWMAGRPDM